MAFWYCRVRKVELYTEWDGDKSGTMWYVSFEDGCLEVWAGYLYLSINMVKTGVINDGPQTSSGDPGSGGIP